MSRSLHSYLKFSALLPLAAFALSGCGGGSSGVADLNEGSGGSTVTVEAPVTVADSFNFKAPLGYFVIGTPPQHARFSGGTANGRGAWTLAPGQVGVVDFGTPADAVKFSAKDNYTGAAAGSGTASQKTALARTGSEKVDPPFEVPLFVRGLVAGGASWDASPDRALKEVADNILEVSLDLTTDANDTNGFKVADTSWNIINCGADASDQVVLGTTLQVKCDPAGGGPPNLKVNLAENGKYKFRFDVTGADKSKAKLTVTKDTGGGGGNGGGEPEPTETIEIRIYAVDVLTPGAQPALLKTVKGTGTVNVDELRRGGETRITRVEVENKATEGNVGIEDFSYTANPRFAPQPKPIDVNYRRASGGYANTRITIGGQTYACAPTTDSAFGCVVKGVPVLPFANVSMSVSNGTGTTAETINFNAGDVTQPVFAFSGSPEARTGTPGETGKPAALPRNANEVILFYQRPDGKYDGWGVHLFPVDPGTGEWTLWPNPHPSEGVDAQYGAYFRITLPQNANPKYSANPGSLAAFPKTLGFIIHKGDTKDPGPDQFVRIAENGNMVFVVSEVNDVSSQPPLPGAVKITNAAAHWVNKGTVLWRPAASLGVTKAELLYSPDGSIRSTATGLQGSYSTIVLGAGTNPKLPNMRHLWNHPAYGLPGASVDNAKNLARGQLVVLGRNADGDAVAATNVQISGALDDLYAAAAKDVTLGPVYTGGVPGLKVWAPTALTNPGVSVKIYDVAGALKETVPMTLDAATGVWSVAGKADWNRQYYRIALRVWSSAANAMVDNEVTDPYSVSLATDSVRSQFVNLDDADLKPAGWDAVRKPVIEAPEDIVLYELHVRDFSIADATVPAADRGKYTAFDVAGTAGRQQLQALAQAGLTHVHILPAFDIATVRERRQDRVELDDDVAKLCAANPAAASLCPGNNGKTIRTLLNELTAQNRAGEQQQQIVEWLRGLDGFNWGYDPYHFGAPEGSYATDPEGVKRILEFRRMVKGLADAGLGTVMDVVYNHTNAWGQNSTSVLDKLVPGYYHRLDATTGGVTTDGCCPNTAPEFRMMEKLVTDTGVRWARDYKVDGFRFDIMGLHPLDTMQRFQDAVKAVNPKAYVYGEAWNFGVVQNDARFVQARQAQLGGTGIGSFNDRMRDAVRGGGPFDSGIAHVRNQGFISGQFYAPNAQNSGADAEKTGLLKAGDQIRVWQAGGLDTYRFVNYLGNTVSGREIDYGGQESGYTEDPSEAINYIEAHDNETLWDISAYKHATGTPSAARTRAQNVGNSTVILAQGIPFLHAGEELLRSKSMDRNSYDSGDWFNEVDWTSQLSKWAVGLPPKGDNTQNYAQLPAIFADTSAESTPADRRFAADVTREWLQIRKSSTLFRLRTAEQIKGRVTMLNTGTSQMPGVVGYRIDGCSTPELPNQPYGAVVTIYNPTTNAVALPLFKDEAFVLHPVQQNSVDATVRTAKHDATAGFTVPARTTAVFVKTTQVSCAPFPVAVYVRGSFTDWAANPAYELKFVGGSAYATTGAVPTGAQQFKIADFDWKPATNCGGASAGVQVRLATPLSIVCRDGSENLSFTPPAAGNYVFALDATNVASPTLTVSAAPPTPKTLFVRGGFNDWGNGPSPTAPMAWDGLNTYRAVIPGIAAGNYDFKIADADWLPATNCGANVDGASVTLGQPFPLTCADGTKNIRVTVPTAGSYLFAARGSSLSSLALTVEKAPFAATLYVRGLNGDWSDAVANRMTYLGGGLYQYKRALAISAQQFKIADKDWTDGTNCGATTALTVGQPLTLACAGPGNDNIAFSVPAAGTYTFTLDATNTTAPKVTVTGP